MTFNRREFLKRSGLVATVAGVATTGVRCTDEDESPVSAPSPDTLPRYEYDGAQGPETMFQHGVASGDPTSSSVILWTHVSPEDLNEEAEVWWEIATDTEFLYRVEIGTFVTDDTRDHTVKLDVESLAAGQTYYYRFMYQGRTSSIGRTRLAPAQGGKRLRFGVMSCASYTSAYFHAYGYAAKRHDLDAVLHLGDYIYEYGQGRGEIPQGKRPLDPPTEILSLGDYRRRYAFYRKDKNLQEVHRQFPFIVIWDDHETANNSFPDGAGNHNAGEGDWQARKDAGIQAYFEWLPIRDNDEQRIWRTIRYGDLVELIMLDTRLWGRDEQTGSREAHYDEDRTLLGEDQRDWLDTQLKESDATWKIVAQQVMMGQLKTTDRTQEQVPGILNNDQWDGYEASRVKFLNMIQQEEIENVVVLTGDIHSSWAIELSVDPANPDVYDPDAGKPAAAVEFVTPGIASSGIPLPPSIARNVARVNEHIKWFDTSLRGYMVLDVTPEAVESTWYLMEDATQLETKEIFGNSIRVANGSTRLEIQSRPPLSPTNVPEPAP